MTYVWVLLKATYELERLQSAMIVSVSLREPTMYSRMEEDATRYGHQNLRPCAVDPHCSWHADTGDGQQLLYRISKVRLSN